MNNKCQNNPNKSKSANWHRNSMQINLLLSKLNMDIKEFEKQHRVKLVVKSDLDRTLYFEKVFFEEIEPNVIIHI